MSSSDANGVYAAHHTSKWGGMSIYFPEQSDQPAPSLVADVLKVPQGKAFVRLVIERSAVLAPVGLPADDRFQRFGAELVQEIVARAPDKLVEVLKIEEARTN